MDLKNASKLSLTKSSLKIILDNPDVGWDKSTLSPSDRTKALNRIFHFWLKFLTTIEGKELLENFIAEHGDEDPIGQIRTSVVQILGVHFDDLISPIIYLDAPDDKHEFPEALKLDAFKRLLVSETDPDPKSTKKMSAEQLGEFYESNRVRVISHSYFGALTCVYFVKTLKQVRTPGMEGPISSLEQILHHYVRDLFKETHGTPLDYIAGLAIVFTESILEKTLEAYTQSELKISDHKHGPFSSIRLNELSLIAKRDERMIKSYGEPHLAKVFEHQLALVIQSFGLYVVSTKTGKSTVDLICITSSESSRHTFLIEAKSTKRNYALPKSDSRALRDYVNDVRKNLNSLPPLTCVIVVADSPAKTLSNKIKALESDARIPVRFLRAKDLALLREQIVGTLPESIFAEELLSASHIIESETIKNIVEAHGSMQQAHVDFVDKMFSLRS